MAVVTRNCLLEEVSRGETLPGTSWLHCDGNSGTKHKTTFYRQYRYLVTLQFYLNLGKEQTDLFKFYRSAITVTKFKCILWELLKLSIVKSW